MPAAARSRYNGATTARETPMAIRPRNLPLTGEAIWAWPIALLLSIAVAVMLMHAIELYGAVTAEADRAEAAAKAGAAASAASSAASEPALPPVAGHRTRLLKLFMLAGALGGALHGLGSLVVFVGNREFRASWSLWYLTLPLRGALLALGFYALLQGGLLGGVAGGANNVAILAMVGASFLVGLFSDRALDKLRDVFNVVFPRADRERRDALSTARARPVIESVSIDTANGELVVAGRHFADGDGLEVGGAALAVRRATATQLLADAAGLARGVEVEVAVVPADGRTERSDAFRFTPG